jgi:hypothetical protein
VFVDLSSFQCSRLLLVVDISFLTLRPASGIALSAVGRWGRYGWAPTVSGRSIGGPGGVVPQIEETIGGAQMYQLDVGRAPPIPLTSA